MKPSQLQALLSQTIKARLPVLIKGAPGVGKSDIVGQATAAAGAHLILSHPVVSDPVDYKGLPTAVNGIAEFLPFGTLRKACEATEPTVFFLDDLGQAPPAVQAACMQLLLAREIEGHKISDHVTFIAATNRRQDRAGVSGMLEPVKSRFATIVELEPDPVDWVNWAFTANIPTELIAFVRMRPDFITKFVASAEMTNSACPRTLAHVGKLMRMGIPIGLEYEVFEGAAGEGFAAEYTGFLRTLHDMPDPDAVLLDPANAPIPEEPSTLYALMGAIAYRATENNAPRVFQYIERLPGEFGVMLVRDAGRARKDFQKTRSFIEWASKNTDVIL